MMTKNQSNEREQLKMLTIEQLVPKEHLVRKLDVAMNKKSLTLGHGKLPNTRRKGLVEAIHKENSAESYIQLSARMTKYLERWTLEVFCLHSDTLL